MLCVPAEAAGSRGAALIAALLGEIAERIPHFGVHHSRQCMLAPWRGVPVSLQSVMWSCSEVLLQRLGGVPSGRSIVRAHTGLIYTSISVSEYVVKLEHGLPAQYSPHITNWSATAPLDRRYCLVRPISPRGRKTLFGSVCT